MGKVRFGSGLELELVYGLGKVWVGARGRVRVMGKVRFGSGLELELGLWVR